MSSALAATDISHLIYTVRGQRVILDADLARIYGVETRVLNQAVKRNRRKFPGDFLFKLTAAEVRELNRSQIVIGSQRHRDFRFPPHAFTEHGAIMAANVLNSPRTDQMSLFVIRAFVKMRSLFGEHRALARQLAALDKRLTQRLDGHEGAIVDVLRRLMDLLDPPPMPEPKRRRIGFDATGAKD